MDAKISKFHAKWDKLITKQWEKLESRYENGRYRCPDCKNTFWIGGDDIVDILIKRYIYCPSCGAPRIAFDDWEKDPFGGKYCPFCRVYPNIEALGDEKCPKCWAKRERHEQNATK